LGFPLEKGENGSEEDRDSDGDQLEVKGFDVTLKKGDFGLGFDHLSFLLTHYTHIIAQRAQK
jgi:hypothetical protein